MRTLEFQLGELFTNLRRNGVLTVAALVTVMASLATASLFYLLHRNLESLLDEEARKAQISAFLVSDLEPAGLNKLRGEIEAIPGVASVEYVSSQAALERMVKELDLKPDERALLGGRSRLPAKFSVQPTQPEAIEQVAEQLKTLTGVEEVRFGKKVVAPLNELKRRVRQFGWLALLALGVATGGIISNAIRLTIYARRREIRIMQLVGATDGFVRTPFLLEGLFHGIVGGLLALVVTTVLYDQLRELNQAINPWLKLVSLQDLMPGFGLGLVGMGIVLALGSTVLSIGRFLREA